MQQGLPMTIMHDNAPSQAARLTNDDQAAGTPKAVEHLQAAAVASWSRCASTPRAEQRGGCGLCCAGK